MTGTAAIEAVGLSAGYGGVPAIRDVDLRVEAGEMVALLGANGAGKTTTLMVLAGAVKALSGQVSLFGRVDNRSYYRRARGGLALLPEQRCVFMGLTVRENLLLGRGDVDQALALFPELERRLNVRAGLTSGGEQQMLSLARVLITSPYLLVADELSLGLAPKVVGRVFEGLERARKEGIAVILIEQYVHRALAFADECLVLERGEVAWIGPAGAAGDEVLRHYLGEAMTVSG
jgi:ABC-type branched-subunit amino acid transport system ATPase component